MTALHPPGSRVRRGVRLPWARPRAPYAYHGTQVFAICCLAKFQSSPYELSSASRSRINGLTLGQTAVGTRIAESSLTAWLRDQRRTIRRAAMYAPCATSRTAIAFLSAYTPQNRPGPRAFSPVHTWMALRPTGAARRARPQDDRRSKPRSRTAIGRSQDLSKPVRLIVPPTSQCVCALTATVVGRMSTAQDAQTQITTGQWLSPPPEKRRSPVRCRPWHAVSPFGLPSAKPVDLSSTLPLIFTTRRTAANWS